MHRGANPAVPVRQPRTEANSDGIAEYLRYKCRQPNSCRHFLICPSCCQPSSSSLQWRYCPTPKDHPCTIKRTSLITLVGAEETLAKTFPATGNAPRSRLRICAQIGSWSVRRQRPYHYPNKLLLPFGTKSTVLGGSRFPRPASLANLRTRYSPYFKLMGNNTPANQQERRPRKRRAPLKRCFLSKTR